MIEKQGNQNYWIRIRRFVLWPNYGSRIPLERTLGTWCLEVPYLLPSIFRVPTSGILGDCQGSVASHLVLMFPLFRPFISSFSHCISDHLSFTFWFKHLLFFRGDWYLLVLLKGISNSSTFVYKNISPVTCRIWPKQIAQLLSETSAPYWKK